MLFFEKLHAAHFTMERRLPCFPAESFSKNTVNGTTWAVTLFGDWRSHKNRPCVEEQHLDIVYLNKPFSVMSGEEINYSVPFFIAKIKKRDDTYFPPT